MALGWLDHLAWSTAEIATIEAAMAARQEALAQDLAQRVARLLPCRRIGARPAAASWRCWSEFGRLDGKVVRDLAGVAPVRP